MGYVSEQFIVIKEINMAFKNRFPKPTLIFLGIACEITDWKTIFIDFQSNKVYFTAKCDLTVGGFPVFLENCQFIEELIWQLDQNDPYTAITASEFNLSRIDPTTMQISFSVPLAQIEALLSLPG